MRIPPYQWLMPEQKSNCDFCDEVSISSEYEPKFQVLANEIETENLFPNGDYEYNPFSPIIGTTFRFDVNSLPALGSYFTIYVGSKIYIFKRSTTENEIIQGNLHIVEFTVINLSGYIARIVNIFNSTIGVDFGTGSSASSNTITTINVPSGSYLDDTAFNLLSNITTVGASIAGIDLENGFYNKDTKQMNYLYLNPFLSGSMVLKTDVDLEISKRYRLKLGYATISNYQFVISVVDPTLNTVFFRIINPLGTSFTGNELNFYFSVPATDTYSIQFSFTAENTSSQLAFDNVSIYEMEILEDIESIDCNGNAQTVESNVTLYDNISLIEILESLPNPFQLKFTDSNYMIFYSRWYSIKESDDCDVQFKIDWTNNCKFSELDYTNLPFTNQLLLKGVKIKNPLEVLDSVDNITPDGRKVSIYKNTQQTFELRLHPYSEKTQNTLERIFDHSEVKINNELYNATEAYQTSEVDLGVYTGRVDLYKDGTQVITSSCCC